MVTSTSVGVAYECITLSLKPHWTTVLIYSSNINHTTRIYLYEHLPNKRSLTYSRGGGGGKVKNN